MAKAARVLGLLGRIAVTGGLLAWTLGRVDLRAAASALGETRFDWLFAALLAGAANLALGAARWRLVLDRVGLSIPYRRSLTLTFVGQFFNTYAPTGYLGDLVRAHAVGSGGNRLPAFGSVMLDRVAALLAVLLLCGAAATLPGARVIPGASVLGPSAAGGAVLLAILIARADALSAALAFVVSRLPFERTAAASDRLRAAIVGWPLRRLLLLLGYSLAMQLVVVFLVAMLCRAASCSVPFDTLLLVVPVTVAATFLPITIAGLGVREATLVGLLGFADVEPARALQVSALFLLVMLLLSAFGGFVWLWTRRS